MFKCYKDYFGEGFDIVDWDIADMTGYEPMTTFYTDFSIADHFGKGAIIDTYKRATETAKSFGYKYQTELAMVLNWKIWEHYERNNMYAETYNELWEKYGTLLMDTLKDDELSYYFRTTD